MYYLTSRFYDPDTGRFVNADGYVSTGQGLNSNNMFTYCGNNPVSREDYTGLRYCESTSVRKESKERRSEACQWQQTVVRGEIYNVGAARPYVPTKSIDYNCYPYALGLTESKYVGGSNDAVTNYDVNNVAEMVLADAIKDGRKMRIIDSYNSPINNNEYRIALRTSAGDYHFMVQHNDGRWSHKPGIGASRLIDGDNPDEVSWDVPIFDLVRTKKFNRAVEDGVEYNYYQSGTVYFAVTV